MDMDDETYWHRWRIGIATQTVTCPWNRPELGVKIRLGLERDWYYIASASLSLDLLWIKLAVSFYITTKEHNQQKGQ